MSEKEYIVSLAKGVDAASFAAEMTQTAGNATVPNRSVDVANAREASARNTHYSLTDEEAATLANDPRVVGVEIPPDQRDDIEIGHNAIQTGDFRKSTGSGVTADRNWGMYRGTRPTDPWGSGTELLTENFKYTLTGKGVDVVIQDSGVQQNHPEWNNEAGQSRLINVDWYAESGITGTQNANHNRDYDGHGSHCAGTVAGKYMGWAKDAQIYSVKVAGLEGTGDSGTGINVSDCFDVIKLWHRNKQPDPRTGVKRPTVVNASWGYSSSTSVVETSGTYAGYNWSNTDTGFTSNTLRWANCGYIPTLGGLYRYNVRVSSVDTDLQECLDEGIIFCIAAGNSYYYIDSSTGDHYNDRFGTRYPFRGSSPYDDEAFIVGNMDITYQGTKEQKAESSCWGPGVNIWAPGTEIISVGSTDNGGTSVKYTANGGPDHPDDSNYKLMKISGTSMAAPQVAGMVACVLEANPEMTPAAVKTYIENNAKAEMFVDPIAQQTPATFTADMTNNGSSAYTLSNAADRTGLISGDNATITIAVGDTLTVTNNASSAHPLYFKSAQGTGTGNQVDNPTATGQGASGGGTVSWTPGRPGTYYYQCSSHSAMNGEIVVTAEVDWDDDDSIGTGPNRVFYSPLWDNDKPVQFKGGAAPAGAN